MRRRGVAIGSLLITGFWGSCGPVRVRNGRWNGSEAAPTCTVIKRLKLRLSVMDVATSVATVTAVGNIRH
ncbi:hypothetical protein RE9431_01830 [Prescottella equi]|nr:hypothetical protein RE9431_01830 [Prescottella equi]BCN71582.1 hypothetical protein RE0327_01810 [Prescottella equi]